MLAARSVTAWQPHGDTSLPMEQSSMQRNLGLELASVLRLVGTSVACCTWETRLPRPGLAAPREAPSTLDGRRLLLVACDGVRKRHGLHHRRHLLNCCC